MPPFESVTVVLPMAVGAPATVTFESPRGASRNGMRSGQTPDPAAVGVAVTAPRTVTRAPGACEAAGNAATSAGGQGQRDIERILTAGGDDAPTAPRTSGRYRARCR